MSQCLTPTRYATDLLAELGALPRTPIACDPRTEPVLWADSGAQILSGHPDGPPLPAPAPLATAARGAWLALASLGPLDSGFPAHRLLGERAAVMALKRRGDISPGGSCRLLDCADGSIALNLPREEDWRLLPAWIQEKAEDWPSLARILTRHEREPLVSRARMLGLAATISRPPTSGRSWFHSHRVSSAPFAPSRQPLVIDLSGLWAGPLCAQILGDMGARVIKVESSHRPDGARSGPQQFFDLLNANKESVVLDFTSPWGRDQLSRLLSCADIVIESSRPRGLEQLGIKAGEFVANGSTWLSITGYGRTMPLGNWIAYGDDAGVAAGLTALLADISGKQVFCGDAIADPLTGLHAALLAWHSWAQGGGALLDVSLTGVLERCIAAGGKNRIEQAVGIVPNAPRARRSAACAVAAGADTTAVLAEFHAPG